MKVWGPILLYMQWNMSLVLASLRFAALGTVVIASSVCTYTLTYGSQQIARERGGRTQTEVDFFGLWKFRISSEFPPKTPPSS